MADYFYTLVNITFESKEKKDQFVKQYWYDNDEGICNAKVIPVPDELRKNLAKPQLGLAVGDTEQQRRIAEEMGFYVLSDNLEENPTHKLGELWGNTCVGFDHRILANDDTFISETWTNKWCPPFNVIEKLSDDPLVEKFIAVGTGETSGYFHCVSENVDEDGDELREANHQLRYKLGYRPVCKPGF